MERFFTYFVIIEFIIILFLLIIWLIYKLLKAKVGDCKVQWDDNNLKVEGVEYKDEHSAIISFSIPLKSVGKKQIVLIDMIGRIHPEGDKYAGIDTTVFVFDEKNKRNDHYFEATLVKPGTTMNVRGEICLRSLNKPVKAHLGELGYIEVAIFYKYYAFSPLAYDRKIVHIELSPYIEKIEGEPVERYETKDEGQKALPIRTPLLRPGDDIYEIFDKYVKKHLKEGDVLSVAESALAIMQGRVRYVEEIKPGFLAKRLNKLFNVDSSMSSVYSVQVALEEVGTIRFIFAIFMGILGKIFGKAGYFYLFAGREVATIDDCTGTLPPFDKCVVMGPKDPKRVALEFKKKTGVNFAVVDANDLGKVDVIGIADPKDLERVIEALKPNPQGNANEQTPLILIRK